MFAVTEKERFSKPSRNAIVFKSSLQSIDGWVRLRPCRHSGNERKGQLWERGPPAPSGFPGLTGCGEGLFPPRQSYWVWWEPLSTPSRLRSTSTKPHARLCPVHRATRAPVRWAGQPFHFELNEPQPACACKTVLAGDLGIGGGRERGGGRYLLSGTSAAVT